MWSFNIANPVCHVGAGCQMTGVVFELSKWCINHRTEDKCLILMLNGL